MKTFQNIKINIRLKINFDNKNELVNIKYITKLEIIIVIIKDNRENFRKVIC